MGELIRRRSVLLGLAATAIPVALPFAARGSQPGGQTISDKFSLVDPGAVRLQGFLGERCRKNERVRLLGKDEEELLGGFRNRPGRQAWVGEHVGKWLHAATLAWAYTKDPELRAKLDRIAAALIATQQEDGYLGTYADGAHWAMGKSESRDVWVHKYDLLGLLTHYTHTGNSASLEAARKVGDLLLKTFGREGALNLNERSTHVGMASGSVMEPMVLLYRATNEEKYLDFARFIAERWEEEKGPKLISALTGARAVRKTANAKAYEMLSCLVGLCELYRATGDAKYLIPAGNAWNDILANHLLPTGSGSSREHWTDEKLYLSEAKSDVAETCVTITWIQLTQQLLRLTGEARYADELEKTIYNHLAAAQRPDGAAWSYFTALDGKKPYKTEQNCCTSSGPRGWAMLPTLAYMTSEDGIVVNLFAPGTAMLRIDGETVSVRQETRYPLDGRVTITVTVPKPMKFALRVRVPAWSSLNGIKADPGRYWTLRQTWSKAQIITLDFALPIRVINGEGSNAGKIALARGPQILAVDQLYNPGLGAVNAAAPATPTPRLTPSAEYRDPDGLPIYETEGVLQLETEKAKAGDLITLRLVPFAAAGAHGHEYAVWLPRPNGSTPAKSA
ncbi:MAG: glycoside hydrolase family 127 protein [Blastocatellia bacterium]|nr:glycoside hydrolase family 127 protein [Blastocatellia bacterium]